MKLSEYTVALLNDIESRIDPEVEDDYYAQWKEFWYGTHEGLLFTPKRKKTTAPGVELRSIHINDALHDFERMLCSELVGVSHKLWRGTDALGIRANYGTGIMTTLFGAELFEMPRSTNTLPTTRSWNDSDRIREMLEKGIPDLRGGLGDKVLSFGEKCMEIFESYPKIKKYVSVYHPDTQGPLDIAELLWGGEMFYEMYDDPDFVHAVLRTVTDTYRGFMEKWFSIVPIREELSVHWGIFFRGGILIRLDSAMNLSCDFYDAFSKPYDKELFDHFGGGCLHFCGKGDHFVGSLCELENMYGINMSQPHLNDMAKIFDAVSARGKRLFNFPDGAKYADPAHLKTGLLQTR